MDCWKGRSKEMICKTCMFFVGKGKVSREKGMIGRCRRRAPSMNGFPVVWERDWCGVLNISAISAIHFLSLFIAGFETSNFSFNGLNAIFILFF